MGVGEGTFVGFAVRRCALFSCVNTRIRYRYGDVVLNTLHYFNFFLKNSDYLAPRPVTVIR